MGTFDWIRLILGCAFIICGLVIFFTEIFGVFHFQYVLNRMHATAMGDTLGIASCMLGLVIFSGFNMTSVKILLIVVFLWFASPVSSHVLARLEVATNENLESRCKVYTDLEALEKELSDNTAAAAAPEAVQQSETGGKEL
ncbi:MAG: monovalent cation/H(+) antiporter subunit G [Lachnospiraceae bacterium]|nr:monovalent cation/H(+) antiporter subunit G [Lachnospiraceae bacterium]